MNIAMSLPQSFIGDPAVVSTISVPTGTATMLPTVGETGSIRSFDRQDIPSVCALFFNTFRRGKHSNALGLGAALEATYLSSPSYSAATGSIVHVNARGCIDGFLGVINVGLRIGHRSLSAGVLSAYMAENPASNPTIGVRLVRAIVSRPLDVIFTDTANHTSLDISRAMRFNVVPIQSLEWTKILRPVGTGAYLLGRRLPFLARPINAAAPAIDALVKRPTCPNVNDRTIEGTMDRPIGMADFVNRAPGFIEPFVLRPSWDHDELTWLMTQAALRTKNGPLHIREVLDRRGRTAGLYLLYARRGGVAYALQVLALTGREDMVIGNLIMQANRLGAVSVRGPVSTPVLSGLLRQKGIFYRHIMSTIVRTSDPDVTQALRAGDVFLGGLAGETWARIFGDEFS